VEVNFGPPLVSDKFSVRLDPAKSREELAGEITQALPRPPQDMDKLLDAIKNSHDEGRQDARAAWGFTLTPPIVILAAGLCLAWILRGFRSLKTQP